MKKLLFALLGAVIVLSSCSKHSQVSCPSFKDSHRDISWSFELPKSPKKKSHKAQVSNRNLASVDNSVREDVSLDLLTTRPANSDLYASTEPGLISVPEVTPVTTDNKTEQAVRKSSGKAGNVQAVSSKENGKNQVVLKKAKKEEAKKPLEKKADGKSQLVALILAIFVGGLGIHRFYLGYTTIGIIQLLTAGGCGIWALIDIIRIATGDLQPKNGRYTETL